MKNKTTIEQLANYFVNHFHKGYILDFDRDIKQLWHLPVFTLKIHQNGKLERMYHISAIDSRLAYTSQPFTKENTKYFNNNLTNPPNNYWIGFVIGEGNKCTSAQRFQVPLDLYFKLQ